MDLALRQRLPSAAAAIAVQAGLFALLVMSFEAVRRATEREETILHLMPVPRPMPRTPVIIDGRGKPRPAPHPPAATAPPPAWAKPGFALPGAANAIQLAPQPGAQDCRPGTACAGAQAGPREDKTRLSPPPVRNQQIWESEIERRNTPPRVPCVSLTHDVVGMDGFAREDNGARVDIACALKALRDGPALLPPVRGAPDPNPPRAHASDEAFARALQAVNARKRALSARPAPTVQAGASP